MTTIYNSEKLREIFRNKFNLNVWTQMLQDFFNATQVRVTPEKITDAESNDEGFYLGKLTTADHYDIGFFYYKISHGSVANKRVGLRKLVKPFLSFQFDAALVVFDSSDHWRLSFICDIKGEATSPKRYTYVFGNQEEFYNTPVGRFRDLYNMGISFENLMTTFSVEALAKQFYNDLFEWYQWAISEDVCITFPNNTSIEDDDRENLDIKIIRMITRIMFVWFIKQKGLVPEKIFNEAYLKTILKDFNPQDEISGTYYNAILQNLFFATLNRAIKDEDGNPRAFADNVNSRDLKSLYWYAELFTISETQIIELFSSVPFLNGGLFECLDKTKTIDGVERAYNYDGFSRNDKKFADGRYRNRAVVPNYLFFKKEKGLFSILIFHRFDIIV